MNRADFSLLKSIRHSLPRHNNRAIASSLRRWSVILFTAALFALFLVVDGRLKASSRGGFYPAGAYLLAQSSDFGAFWSGLEAMEVYGRLRADGFDPIGDAALLVRRSSGIRPTPRRWRTWFGGPVTAAFSPEGLGFCTRPGVLFRGAAWGRQLFSQASRNAEILTWGPLFYGWRDGFLIAGTTAAYVAAAQAGVEAPAKQPGAKGGLLFTSFVEPCTTLSVSATEGFPVSGTIAVTLAARTGPLTLRPVRPQRHLLTAAGFHPQDLTSILREILGRLPNGGMVLAAVNEGLQAVPEGWATGEREYALAISGLDATSLAPIPQTNIVLKMDGDRAPFETPPGAIAYEWSSEPGWVVPWAGEGLAAAGAADGSLRYLSSDEPSMAAHFKTYKADGATEGDFTAALDWRTFSDYLAAYLIEAAHYELIPRMNREDVEHRVIPYVQMLGHLGEFSLTAWAEDGQVRLEGFLGRETSATETAPS